MPRTTTARLVNLTLSSLSSESRLTNHPVKGTLLPNEHVPVLPLLPIGQDLSLAVPSPNHLCCHDSDSDLPGVVVSLTSLGATWRHCQLPRSEAPTTANPPLVAVLDAWTLATARDFLSAVPIVNLTCSTRAAWENTEIPDWELSTFDSPMRPVSLLRRCPSAVPVGPRVRFAHIARARAPSSDAIRSTRSRRWLLREGGCYCGFVPFHFLLNIVVHADTFFSSRSSRSEERSDTQVIKRVWSWRFFGTLALPPWY